ncbi:MAG: beta-lactamase family protein [Gammaproteobacteria bacterium]|nr:beta-lactamase family protein [Gammaproteobacteria bacterium]
MSSPEDAGVDPGKLMDLSMRIKREVDEGLLPSAQIAVARNGRLVYFETYGDATNQTLYCIFSSTKAITSAAAWLLIQEGKLNVDDTVTSLIPEFAGNGKGEITIEQLFLHTAGFPHAPFRVEDWADKQRRLERFASWRLNWEPGSQFEYHPTSSMWIIAELIERQSGQSYASFVRDRISLPLGLEDLWVGIPEIHHHRIATISHHGEELTEDDYKALGLPVPPITEVTTEAIESFNRPINRITPVPGGGGTMSAADLALFYQGLLGNTHSGEKIWNDETMAFVTKPRTGDLIDPMTGSPVNRGLGIVISGDEKRSHRGFGHTNSPSAFGHAGAGGQIAWADPETGISFAYLTNGHDRNRVRQTQRSISISNLAAICSKD